MTDMEEIRKLIFMYGGIDGGHHKQWLLDQILQKTFPFIEEYDEWVKQYENGSDGPKTYVWDTGIAP